MEGVFGDYRHAGLGHACAMRLSSALLAAARERLRADVGARRKDTSRTLRGYGKRGEVGPPWRADCTIRQGTRGNFVLWRSKSPSRPLRYIRYKREAVYQPSKLPLRSEPRCRQFELNQSLTSESRLYCGHITFRLMPSLLSADRIIEEDLAFSRVASDCSRSSASMSGSTPHGCCWPR